MTQTTFLSSTKPARQKQSSGVMDSRVVATKATSFRRKLFNAFFLLLIAAIFCTLFSFSTSPLYHIYSQDSAVFMMIGEGILDGMVPYRDLFENKGPLLYFLEAFPQIFVEGRLGVFLLQTVFLWLVLSVWRRITVLLLNNVATNVQYVVPVLYLIYLIFCLSGGNLSEEYSNFFSVIAVYLLLRAIVQQKPPGSIGCAALGACTSCVFFIRVNDVAGVLVISLFAVYLVFRQKRIAKCVTSVLAYLAGFALVALPIFMYYIYHNALQDMMYGYFYINFKYVSAGLTAALIARIKVIFSIYGVFSIVPTLLAVLNMYLARKSDRSSRLLRLFCLVYSLAVFASLYVSESGYMHYLITNALPLVLNIVLLAQHITATQYYRTTIHPWLQGNHFRNATITGILLLVFVGHLVVAYSFDVSPLFAKPFFLGHDTPRDYEVLAEYIPKEDYDSVYGIDISSDWYYANNILPSYRHFLPIVYFEINPDEARYFQEYMEETPPKWLVCGGAIEESSALTPETISIIMNNYRQVAMDSRERILYQLID